MYYFHVEVGVNGGLCIVKMQGGWNFDVCY